MYKKIKLNNGLRIIANRMAAKQSLALGIWIKVGGRYESSQNKGTSHFLEHLLFKGSKKYSCRQIKESIEGVGGSLNGFTSEEVTCYLVKIPARYQGLALDILSDMVLNPSLDKTEVEKEKTVILEELKMYRDLPQSYVYELLDELLWPGQPLGEPIIGTHESVSTVTPESLSLFRKKYYSPSNIVISAAGAVDLEKLSRDARKIFTGLKTQGDNTFQQARQEQSQAQLKIFPKDTEQTHLAMGFHSFKRDHPLRHAQGLLHVILGGNMSSRLFNELRENRGLAYEIGTQVKRFYDAGAFVVHAGIDNQKVNQGLELILEELGKIKQVLVTPDELKRAKEFYLGQLALALEDTMDYMLWIGENTACLDKTYTLKEVCKEVNSIKAEDLSKVAAEIFQESRINLSLIGPLKDRESDIYRDLRIK